MYLRLPGDARLWLAGEEFARPDRPALIAALGAPQPRRAAAETPGEYEPTDGQDPG